MGGLGPSSVNDRIRKSETAWLNKHDHDPVLQRLDYRMQQARRRDSSSDFYMGKTYRYVLT